MRRALWLSVLSGLALPPRADAFSDEERFVEDSATGGGGGRYFTGSPVDGYGCAVCHRGGEEVRVQISGLPERFVPNTTYEVQVALQDLDASHALALELVMPPGEAAGSLALPAPESVPAAQRCQAQASGSVPTTLHDVAGRQVLTLRDCGAQGMSFRWTAPEASEVTFAVGIVRSDASGTAEGDGVRELSRVLLSASASREVEAGCAVGKGEQSPLPLAVLAGLSWLVRRRRRAR